MMGLLYVQFLFLAVAVNAMFFINWFGLQVLAQSRSSSVNRTAGVTAPKFPAIFAFGDSILDTGNNNELPTIAKCNFPPYGRDFIGSQPTGRFSNGRVPSDFLASKLGIKELLPPYLSPNLSNEDLLTGVCFASGSSGYDGLTNEVMSVLSMQDQLELFKEYKEKVQAITDPETAAMIFRESLYVICTGNNDMLYTYSLSLRKHYYDVHSYTSFLVTSASNAVKELYKLGARKIIVVGLPPLGCVPSQRTFGGGLQRDCLQLYNQAAKEYNSYLITELPLLQKTLRGTTIVYGNIFDKLLHIIQNPSKYGFEESKKGCCGTGEFEISELCNQKTVTCVDDSKYVFWDSVHPTERTYEIIIDELFRELYFLL